MEIFHAKDGEEWRDWLQRNHLAQKEIWLVFHKKGAGVSGVDFDDAIDWALCFGWIDSAIRKIDDTKYARRFTPRRPGSTWSESNVERAKELIIQGKMGEYGAAAFSQRTTKISSEPPSPPEFLAALKGNHRAWENFQMFSPSHKKRYVMWIMSAKKTETRASRIKDAVTMIAKAKALK